MYLVFFFFGSVNVKTFWWCCCCCWYKVYIIPKRYINCLAAHIIPDLVHATLALSHAHAYIGKIGARVPLPFGAEEKVVEWGQGICAASYMLSLSLSLSRSGKFEHLTYWLICRQLSEIWLLRLDWTKCCVCVCARSRWRCWRWRRRNKFKFQWGHFTCQPALPTYPLSPHIQGAGEEEREH